jgi:hypothetical protein
MPAAQNLSPFCCCCCCCSQVEQNAVDLEGAESPGVQTAQALKTLLINKGIITPQVAGALGAEGTGVGGGEGCGFRG